jgi:hypothetical protein
MPGWKTSVSIMLSQIAESEGPVHLMKNTKYPSPVRKLAKEFTLLIVEAAGEQPLELSCCIEERQGSVPSAHQLARAVDDILKHKLKVQARYDAMCQLI